MIPGINLLSIALGAIASQSGQWLQFIGNTENSQGQDIPQYAPAQVVTGSFQSTDARTIADMGLDVTAKYRTFYSSTPIAITDRSTSPDLLIFYGRKYQVAGELDWINQDGWKGVVLVDIGAA